MRMKELISVIVPVYNASCYLGRCLDSLLGQTYHDLEIIVVDDGSTDNSCKIAKEYAMRDNRVVVVHQSNQGVSAARNKGLEVALGNYVGFVDSDDVVDERMYETLYELLVDNECEVSGCQYCLFRDNYQFMRRDSYVIYDRKESLERLVLEAGITNFLWDKLFKKELFRNLTFKTGKIFEDMDVMYKLLDRVSRIVISEAVLYGYYQREDSYVHTYSYDKLINYIEVYREREGFLQERYPELEGKLKSSLVLSIFVVFRIIVLSKQKQWLDDELVMLEYERLKKLDLGKIRGYKKYLLKLLRFNRYVFYDVVLRLYKWQGKC